MSGTPQGDPEVDRIERLLEQTARLQDEALADAERTPPSARERALVESFHTQLESRFRQTAKPEAISGVRASNAADSRASTRGRVLTLGFRIALAAAILLSATIALSRFIGGDRASQASIHLAGDSMLSILEPTILDQVPEAFECASKLGDGATYRFEFRESPPESGGRVIVSRETTEPRIVLTKEERARLVGSFVLEVTAENELLGVGIHRASLSFSWR